MSRLLRRTGCFAACLALVALAGCPTPPQSDDPLSRSGTVPINGGVAPENTGTTNPTPGAGKAGTGPGTYLLCFWNVENLFDDVDDSRHTKGDAGPDKWFAEDKEALAQKLKNLADVIMALGEGKGPDILALAEVESPRAAELVRQTLNARLSDPALHYSAPQFENPKGGRNIGTAVMSRLAIEAGRTQLLGHRMRILEVHLEAAGKPLALIASHWSSRVSDHTGATRSKYADQIYGRYKGMVGANPKVDFLVCGDFNDNPEDESVTAHLHAGGDVEAVRAGGEEPRMLNLMAGLRQKGAASHFYGTTPYLFDQVCVSPGLLDEEGWSVEPDSAAVVKQMATRQGRPNRFGNATDRRPLSARGASDHFPVTVRLRVR